MTYSTSIYPIIWTFGFYSSKEAKAKCAVLKGLNKSNFQFQCLCCIQVNFFFVLQLMVVTGNGQVMVNVQEPVVKANILAHVNVLKPDVIVQDHLPKQKAVNEENVQVLLL